MSTSDYLELEPVIREVRCMADMAFVAVNKAMEAKPAMDERNTALFAIRVLHTMIEALQQKYYAIHERAKAAA